MRVETHEGVLVVYDAASPPQVGGGCSGYLAYWLSAPDETQYIFPGVLDNDRDVATALLALERDLGVDLEGLADADDRVDAARRASAEAPKAEIVWEPVTLRRAAEIMGFDPGDDSDPHEADDGQTAGVCDPCYYILEPPSNCGSPSALAEEALSVVAGCCRGCTGCCRSPDPCCGSTNPCCGNPDPCCGVNCSDGNPCTYDYCFIGLVTVSSVQAICHHDPLTGTQCLDDGNPCTNDVCQNGSCTHPPRTGVCNINDCWDNEHCVNGICVGDWTCDDGVQCTDDVCETTFNEAGCFFGCQYCAHHERDADCDDNNDCTRDFCGPAGCVHLDLSGETCADDGNICTYDECQSGECAHPPNTALCDDGDPCTGLDQCGGGRCRGTPMNCDDNDVCTINDRCVNGVCVRDPLNCDDGNPCSVETGCDPVLGCLRRWMTCGDDNPCTADACDGATGLCVHAAVEGTCEDSDPCTLGDACTAGNCVGAPDPGCQCPFDYTVDGEGAAEGVVHERTTRVPIATGTRCVWVRAEYFTREFPVYTGQPSVYNDEVSFSVRYPGGTAASGSAVVNDLHALFAAGERPGGTALLDFSTWAQNSPSWIETTAAATNVGDGALGSGVRFRIDCGPGATLSVDPSSIPPHTAWPSMPDYSYSDVIVQWDPPDCEGTLAIAEVVPDDMYLPSGNGTLERMDATKWRYTAFDESPDQKHPKRVVVWIAAREGNQELARVEVVVRTVFNWWVSGHKHGPGAVMHTPDTTDYLNAYEFIRWKYTSCFPVGGAFTGGVSISSTATVPCQIGWFSTVDAAACTTGASVVFGTSAFSRGENTAASVIGHELDHTVGADECQALTWELDHSLCTSIDAAYLQATLLEKIAVCGNL